MIYTTSFFSIKTSENKEFITSIEIINNIDKSKINDDILKNIKKYINKDLQLIGTDFQLKVWNEIAKIPFGETRTYSEIAKNIGNPKAYRAVALACSQNKFAILIPCHRVVGKNNLGGYKWHINKKKYLLDYEKTT